MDQIYHSANNMTETCLPIVINAILELYDLHEKLKHLIVMVVGLDLLSIKYLPAKTISTTVGNPKSPWLHTELQQGDEQITTLYLVLRGERVTLRTRHSYHHDLLFLRGSFTGIYRGCFFFHRSLVFSFCFFQLFRIAVVPDIFLISLHLVKGSVNLILSS